MTAGVAAGVADDARAVIGRDARMRRATRGLLLGYLIFMIPFAVVMAGNWAALAAGRSPQGWAQGLFLMAAAVYGIAAYAMSATIYALRVENPATVADVFD